MRGVTSSYFIKTLITCCQCKKYNLYNRSSHYSSKAADDGDGVWPRRVVTGLQPTGELHIGNYFGAVRRCVRLQDQGEDLMIFIADLHALTTRQSAVPRHAELCWLLACLATQARLAHLPQYKEKAATMKEVPLGLLLYPVLQVVTFDPETRPGVSNLVSIHCLAEDKLPEEVVQEAEGLSTAQYKRVVAGALQRALAPVRERAAELRARPAFLHDVLRHGAARARLRADQVYERAAALAGLR
ncbi:hypothetical protein HF086_010712 [Spodoptera exigua]|uniref:Tryptophanyl-tRNA synthetase n=1 Tax=Spodoptera exigua TaxID=7107 RepID=A0A922M4D2_SPOEX|nr:hypothetical protein HF086_010712 [Spodoptera exigua]